MRLKTVQTFDQSDVKTGRQKDKKTKKTKRQKRQKDKKTKYHDQKESSILRRQGSFAHLQCFFISFLFLSSYKNQKSCFLLHFLNTIFAQRGTTSFLPLYWTLVKGQQVLVPVLNYWHRPISENIS